MQNAAWRKILDTSADPHRAWHHFELLQATSAGPWLRKASAEQAGGLVSVLGASPVLSEALVAHPDWTKALLDSAALARPRSPEGFQHEVHSWLRPLLEKREYAAAYSQIREFKQKEMLRIAARDLARLADAAQITEEISDVADICLS